MRDDPDETTVTLVVELDDGAEPTRLRETVADADGALVEELGFGCWLVRLPETGVADLCDLPDVVRIETDATLERTVDETVEGEASPADEAREV